MDSINLEQPEDNREDLHGKDAVARIREMVDKAETCFFCTAVSRGSSGATRPMAVQKVDDDGTLWFLSASDSHKNRELEEDPAVRLFFQVSEHAGFLAGRYLRDLGHRNVAVIADLPAHSPRVRGLRRAFEEPLDVGGE